ncbi:Macrolide export ATP-binding/permease protein MacB [Pseudobythopirellula maris]|uniref:Macrolide export ATP-binding/permease protein MacB n=1 Tax=Pseudobythopirellula maris TaxID=2527991 RepID=A0A5C5ZRN4_9BACT|nr:ABC transporter ATP-binding protein [Pseudobythopirellula maris]TWT89718.1 Macrolide export ATP-binding/permease protein MacB [Pseudobythopirellula maris]
MTPLTQHDASLSDANGVAPALDLRGLSKSYSRGGAVTQVLHEVSLEIQRGECVFLLGPSGSGKSTLLSIIGCLLSPDAGEVRVLGQDVTRLDLEQRAILRRRMIGFVFQRFHLIRGLSAVENVAVPLRLDGVDASRAIERSLELLDRVGLADKARQPPSRLSVGQCQRVAIARALVADPHIVLADEPTASLDAESGQQAMALLRELTVETGRTLIVVTHDQRIVPKGPTNDRTFEVDSGRLRLKTPQGAAGAQSL